MPPEDILTYRQLAENELGVEEMCLSMDGWTPAYVARIRTAFGALEEDLLDSKQTPDHYVEYLTRQRGLIRKALAVYENSRNDMARVAALSLASSIANQIIKTGQDLGLVDRAAKKVVIAGGLTLTDMSREQLEQKFNEFFERGLRLRAGRPAPLMMDEPEAP